LAGGGVVANWAAVADHVPGRTSKQCRERWFNHLDPNIKRGGHTEDEDNIILAQQTKIGNRWSLISAMLPGRTEDAVKIRWKTLQRVQKGGKPASQKKPRKQKPPGERKLPKPIQAPMQIPSMGQGPFPGMMPGKFSGWTLED
jgi:hypothetical protein